MTVKRNGDLVVLKNGKVSCSCCFECCMYPAQALGDGDYTYDDLPDIIEVLIDNVFAPFSRDGIYFYSDSAIGLIPAGDYRVRLLDNGAPWVPGTEDFQYSWRLELWNGINWGTRDDIDDWQCLIQGLPEDFERTHDQFADTYTISGPLSGTVTRESICVWRGESLTLSNYGYQWKINGNTKSGNQNTPVGSYAGGFTVS